MRIHVRILLLLLVANVVTRFFTNHLGLLPRHFNVADVALTWLLWGLSFFSAPSRRRHSTCQLVAWILPTVNGIAVLAYLANSHQGHLPAAVSQMVMLSEPFLLFLAVCRLGLSELDASRYVKWLGILVGLELIIGIFQVPTFLATGDSESIMGTFQHNAEHYAAFLTIGIFLLLGKVQVEEEGNGFRKIMILGTLGLVLCLDNKASWLGLGVSIMALLFAFGADQRGIAGRIPTLASGILILGVGFAVVLNVSGSVYKFGRLAEIWRNGETPQLGKIKALRDIVASNNRHPHMWLIGSGPGSFYSRAARQYFGASTERLYTEPVMLSGESDAYDASNSMGGVINRADKEPYFSLVQRDHDKIVPLGTGQVDEPFSFYNGILGEVGLLGFLLYLLPYWRLHGVLRRILRDSLHDRKVLPLVAATYGMLIYLLTNSIYGPLLETGRITTILWSLAACCLVFDRRDANDSTECEPTRASNKVLDMAEGNVHTTAAG